MKIVLAQGRCRHCDTKFLEAPWLPHRVAGYCERCASYCVPHLMGNKRRRRRDRYL